jgi:hypothetical protein
MNTPDSRSGRELRLVVLVLVVSVGVLLVAARFRLPAERGTPPPPASPLDQLAVRATYDELAGAITTLVHRVTPSIEIVRMEAGLFPAIRMRPGVLLVHVPTGMKAAALGGEGIAPGAMTTDAQLQVGIIRETGVSAAPGTLPIGAEAFNGFAYVAAVEAAPGGPTARPVFLGRLDPSTDKRWPSAPLVVGGTRQFSPGTLVFTMDGRFVGLVHAQGAELTIVPFSVLDTVVAQLVGVGGGPQ